MTYKEALEEAMSVGYIPLPMKDGNPNKLDLLNPGFWKSLGKAMGWGNFEGKMDMHKKESEWEDRFSDFWYKNMGDEEAVKSFIRKVLSNRENEIAKEVESFGYNHIGIGCGIEDNNITSRYEAAEYGYNEAKREILEIINRNRSMSQNEKCFCKEMHNHDHGVKKFCDSCTCHSQMEWEKEFREYFDKNLKPKKPTMGNLDREILVDFIRKVLSNREKEIAEEVEKESRKTFPTPKPVDYEIGYVEGMKEALSIIRH